MLERNNITVLYNAPAFEKTLIRLLKSFNKNMTYITSDIIPVGSIHSGDIYLDLTNIDKEHYNKYDYIINIHVLEHLRKKEDVFVSIKNIYKMLSVNGIAIIAVPQDFKLDMEILEDPTADPNPDHWRKFGNKFINLLDIFSKIEIILDTNFDIITSNLPSKYEYKDIFFNLKRNKNYADGQVFYLCHK